MTTRRIGLLHPGEMGAGIAGALVSSGHEVSWAASGRSAASRARAKAAGLLEKESVEELVNDSEVIVSICPPHAAAEVAASVAGFTGLYLDANAIAPRSARAVAAIVEAGGARYVDGGIVGAPPGARSAPRLYLSGTEAATIAALFADGSVETRVVSSDPTAASAVKVCFASYTKGTLALLLDIRALARVHGIEADLLAEWSSSAPDLEHRSVLAAHQGATKGWRWVGEMEELALAYGDAGLESGFFEAAAGLYRRCGRDEDATPSATTLDRVLEAIEQSRSAT